MRDADLPNRPAWGGFTLVELVVVLVLAGILAAAALARFDRPGILAPAHADQVTSLLRYAQKLAIARNSPVYVSAEANRLSACFSNAVPCPPADRVPMPGGNSASTETVAQCEGTAWLCLGRPNGVAYVVGGGSNPFAFSALGQPRHGDLSAFRDFSLSVTNGAQVIPVSVANETGYVSRP